VDPVEEFEKKNPNHIAPLQFWHKSILFLEMLNFFSKNSARTKFCDEN
jgi:hypothetical protein